ncbi:MAG: hypothetical protein JW939_05975 [Candidatus Thermoplasmatota archaeon]|nr:hypothetical protein [Candidatus Thermoplasmatota archaeon]
MEPIGDCSWKEYYSRQREENAGHIDDKIMEWWQTEDPRVEKVLSSGGFLSFPHTYLGTSLEPTVRTVRAIYRTGKKKVIALGVMHGVSGYDPQSEFSLDTFRYVLRTTGALLDLEVPELIEIFLPKRARGEKGKLERIREQIDDTTYLHDLISQDTAIVLTGDLAHYGKFYGTKETVDAPKDLIRDSINNGLQLIYGYRDDLSFLEHSLSWGNDQWAVAIPAASLLKGDLAWNVFSMELSDYKQVLQTPPPCFVASVLYGVWPKKKGSMDLSG